MAQGQVAGEWVPGASELHWSSLYESFSDELPFRTTTPELPMPDHSSSDTHLAVVVGFGSAGLLANSALISLWKPVSPTHEEADGAPASAVCIPTDLSKSAHCTQALWIST